MLNVFDNINFNPVANPGTGATIFQVTSAYTDASNTYDPGGRLGQLMFASTGSVSLSNVVRSSRERTTLLFVPSALIPAPAST